MQMFWELGMVVHIVTPALRDPKQDCRVWSVWDTRDVSVSKRRKEEKRKNQMKFCKNLQ